MSRPVAGAPRVSVPAQTSAATAETSRVYSTARFLAREPFVLLVVAVDSADRLCAPTSARPLGYVARTRRRAAGLASGLPHHDTLTVWSHGQPWVDQQWLGQLLFYGDPRRRRSASAPAGARDRPRDGVHARARLCHPLGRLTAERSARGRRWRLRRCSAELDCSDAGTRVRALRRDVLAARLGRGRPSRRVFLAVPLLGLVGEHPRIGVLGAGLVVLWAIAELLRYGLQPTAWALRLRAIALGVARSILPARLAVRVRSSGYYRDVLGSGRVSRRRLGVGSGELSRSVAVLRARGRQRSGSSDAAEETESLRASRAARDALRRVRHVALDRLVRARRRDGRAACAGRRLADKARDASPGVNLVLALGSLAVLIIALVAARRDRRRGTCAGIRKRQSGTVSTGDRRDPSLRVFANEAYGDWLLWNVPNSQEGSPSMRASSFLTAAQLRSLADFRNRSSTTWPQAARGYRLLVLDSGTERHDHRVLAPAQQRPGLFHDHYVTVLLRGRQVDHERFVDAAGRHVPEARSRAGRRDGPSWRRRGWSFSRPDVVLCLLRLFVASVALRIALVARVTRRPFSATSSATRSSPRASAERDARAVRQDRAFVLAALSRRALADLRARRFGARGVRVDQDRERLPHLARDLSDLQDRALRAAAPVVAPRRAACRLSRR